MMDHVIYRSLFYFSFLYLRGCLLNSSHLVNSVSLDMEKKYSADESIEDNHLQP